MRYLVFTILVLTGLVARAQDFRSSVEFQLLACQIDGDNASGYYKMGGKFMLNTTWVKPKIDYLLGIGVAQRGSRRYLGPNGTGIPMNLEYRSLDVKATVGKFIDTDKKWHVNAGLVAVYTLSAKDKEGFIQNLLANTPTITPLSHITAAYAYTNHLYFTASAEYSLLSMVKNNSVLGLRGGSRFNVLGAGIRYIL